jgi:hypothetical protein
MTDRPDDEIRRPGDLADADGPVDSEDMLDDPELGLITDYLMGELPPERVAEVKRRLEEDDAFRELAAPLVLAWSVPPRWKRQPMPRAELVRSWDEFTKRAGFVHQRQKARRRRPWMIRAVLVVLAPVLLAALVFGALVLGAVWNSPTDRHQPGLADVGWTALAPSADSAGSPGGWMTVGNAQVQLEPGARLFRAGAPGYPNLVKLEGSARFLRVPAGEVSFFTDALFFTVFTAAGFVVSPQADFHVRARADTTDVEVLRRAGAPGPGPRTNPDVVLLVTRVGEQVRTLLLTGGEAGRLRPQSGPIKLRHVPGDPFRDQRLFKRLLVILTPWILP